MSYHEFMSKDIYDKPNDIIEKIISLPERFF